MFFKKTIKKVNFTLFTVVKSCEAFQAHMDITFNDAFMDSTWLITKSTSCFFFNIFNKIENLIISLFSIDHFNIFNKIENLIITLFSALLLP